MGQYYRGCILNTKSKCRAMKDKVLAYISSYDFDNGAKLMEHSYLHNDYVNAFESLICEGGKYAGLPVVWAGDYADAEPRTYKGDKVNIYDLASVFGKNEQDATSGKHYRYVINEDKKAFVDTEKMPENDRWIINPLPLLICEGNGRGGGDYWGDDEKFVGIWARDVVIVSDNKPDDTYKELEVAFAEKY